MKNYLYNFFLKATLSWFGLGYIPFAPGTWASLAALPLGFYLMLTWGIGGLYISALMLFCVGWFLSASYLKQYPKNQDPSEIVIDEVVGQLLVLAPTALDPWLISLAFLSFRVFDILKPWPVSWADKLHGSPLKSGLSIMLDDVLAAVYAIGVVLVVRFFLPIKRFSLLALENFL